VPVLLADRFGGGPFLYWDVAVDKRERLLNLLGVEGEVAEAYQGLGPDDHLFGYGPDGYDE
jgi:hypothetical protein